MENTQVIPQARKKTAFRVEPKSGRAEAILLIENTIIVAGNH